MLLCPSIGVVALNVCRFVNGSHIELPCNEVQQPEQSKLAAMFDRRAQSWWASVLRELDSFAKPVYQLGLPGAAASNIEGSGLIEMTRAGVRVEGPLIKAIAEPAIACWRIAVRWLPLFALDAAAAIAQCSEMLYTDRYCSCRPLPSALHLHHDACMCFSAATTSYLHGHVRDMQRTCHQ
jgi:hypothetical protein